MIWNTAFARLLLTVPLLAAGLAIGGPSPASAATTCSEASPIAPGATVRDNVVVPEGATCHLEDFAVVRGTVTVLPGALLYILSGAEVRGSIVATAPTHLDLGGAVVRGSITVTGNSGPTGYVGVGESEVRGDVSITGYTGKQVEVYRSTIRGSVVYRNFVASNSIYANENQIGANLICENLVSDYFYFEDNTVGGTMSSGCVSTPI